MSLCSQFGRDLRHLRASLQDFQFTVPQRLFRLNHVEKGNPPGRPLKPCRTPGSAARPCPVVSFVS